jgi:hypothetical protein
MDPLALRTNWTQHSESILVRHFRTAARTKFDVTISRH